MTKSKNCQPDRKPHLNLSSFYKRRSKPDAANLFDNELL